MKDRKTNLWWCDRLKVGFAVAFVLLAMLGAAVDPVFVLFDCLLLSVFFAVECTMNRCPHCGQRIRAEKPDT